MRTKLSQINAKEFNRVVTMLQLLINICGLSTNWPLAVFFTQCLKMILNILTNTESVKDSKNSSVSHGKEIKPAKPRERGKRKAGGQQGHEGHTYDEKLEPTETHDLTPPGLDNDARMKEVGLVERIVVEVITGCKVIKFYTRVFMNTETGEKVSGEFPDGVNASYQFGDDLKALVIHLREQGFLSYERIAEQLRDVYGIPVCEATLVNIIKDVLQSPVLDDFEEAAKAEFSEAYHLGADETSMSVSGTNYWVHVLVSTVFTFFALHKKRGYEAMLDIGFLINACGVVVHDCWKPYFRFGNFLHCLCNAHILRELEHAIETGHKWAESMKELLLNTFEEVEIYGGMLPLSLQALVRQQYKRVIAVGLMETGGEQLARPPGQDGKRGRIKKSKGRNLLERLREFEDAVLRFMTDSRIPFSNNLAERPIRMLKVRAKVSGCFKSAEMAEGFCKLRGYLVTCKNNNISSYDAIKTLIREQTPEFIKERLSTVERKAA